MSTATPRRAGRPAGHLDLVRVTEVVEEARIEGLRIVATVAAVFDVPTKRASREIQRARDAGLLDPDGHLPARAVLNRGTSRQQEWLACEHCLQPWPCRYISAHRRDAARHNLGAAEVGD